MRRRTLVIVAAAVVVAVGLVLGGWALTVSTAKHAAPHPVASAPVPTTAPTTPPLPPLTLSKHTDYVALGDSFAAGMGAGGETGACLRSAGSYPDVFAAETGVRLVQNASCSGATTTDLLADQLSALDASTDLVSVSIGGNDLDVAALASMCAHGESTPCQKSFASSLNLLNALPARLAQTYAAIARSAPNARIVVTGYTPLFAIPAKSKPAFESIAAVNVATAALDQAISSAVHTERMRGVAISYTSVSFMDHGIGSVHPWIHASGATAYHPTAEGYRHYAEALRKSLT